MTEVHNKYFKAVPWAFENKPYIRQRLLCCAVWSLQSRAYKLIIKTVVNPEKKLSYYEAM